MPDTDIAVQVGENKAEIENLEEKTEELEQKTEDVQDRVQWALEAIDTLRREVDERFNALVDRLAGIENQLNELLSYELEEEEEEEQETIIEPPEGPGKEEPKKEKRIWSLF